MIRIAWAALVVGLAASFVSGGNETVVLVAIVGTVALFAWSLLSGRSALKCPNCGKRVKLGYSTCHHCGAQVARPRPLGAPRHDPMEVAKECSACKSPIRPDAGICPHCRTPQEDVWTLRDGVWWDQDATGAPVWYDQGRRQWVRAGS